MMLTIEPMVVHEPQRLADWLVSDPKRFEFFLDTLYTVRNQYPSTELTVVLTDDDTVQITPSGYDPQQYRVSAYRAIADTLEPMQRSTGYAEFVKNYTDWRGRFQTWWHSWQAFMGQIRESNEHSA